MIDDHGGNEWGGIVHLEHLNPGRSNCVVYPRSFWSRNQHSLKNLGTAFERGESFEKKHT